MMRIFFGGDFCSRDPQAIIVEPALQSVMEGCDYRFLNFEGPIHKGQLNIANSNILPQSDDSPAWCERQGFNIISVANNHALDFSEEGLLATINSFRQSIVLGGGTWEEAYKIKTISNGNMKIGFLAATSSDFASFKDKWTDADRIGCANVMGAEIERKIVTKNDFCDVLILISHAGVEYCNVPLPELRDRYRRLTELGVDAIVAMHPHVPQGYEVYNGKPIFYSLGNFLFDRMNPAEPRHKYWGHGLSLVLEIDDNGGITYQIVPVCYHDNVLGIDKEESILEHEKWLNDVLADDNQYIETVNKEVQSLYPKYKGWLLSSFNAYESKGDLRSVYHFLRGLRKMANTRASLHQLREESTRWLLTRFLKNESNTTL